MPMSAVDALPVVLLMGPTASGKTALALDLAQRLPVEIVSVDSALVYRGMDIGSAKPSLAERAQVPHHLIDILDPAEPYSAARFTADARRLIAEVRARGRVPLLVGGTMLYFRALQCGLSELPPADPQVRARIEAEAQRRGWPAMHAQLLQRDPVTAARLHPNDQQRVQRALEILELTGSPLAELHAQPRQDTGLGRVVKLGLNPPERAVLHGRIAQRFEAMMAAGFLDEVRVLHARGDLYPELPSVRAVGYRQLWAHLDGEVTLSEAVQNGIAATRQFAKRQLTWLRTEPDVNWLDPAAANVTEQALIRLV
jgi:tRNA dimethylallyltransferase